uniref:Uncharacterized protein n=1 Tax=Daucus carota subsp. sativus TaxID=79200 RepID=A0A162A105_DAUCS
MQADLPETDTKLELSQQLYNLRVRKANVLENLKKWWIYPICEGDYHFLHWLSACYCRGLIIQVVIIQKTRST